MPRETVTVCIPTIPPRGEMLRVAIGSVLDQSHRVSQISVAVDLDHDGAWATRNRALRASVSDWTLFLDDDDQLAPWCVEHLLTVAHDEGADVVWGWYEVRGGGDPFPHYRGRQYDPAQPHIVPITYMARTQLLQSCVQSMGGFQPDAIGAWDNQDMPILHCLWDMGAKFRADPRVVWYWNHHGANSSGMPERW